jgi:hypothetical protein
MIIKSLSEFTHSKNLKKKKAPIYSLSVHPKLNKLASAGQGKEKERLVTNHNDLRTKKANDI